MPSLPKLRLLDIRPIVHNGHPSLILRDPLQFSDQTIIVSQALAPALMLCDGTKDASAMSAALAARFGLRVSPAQLDQLLAALDEALLLDNERSAEAHRRALAEYRAAPFRPPGLAGGSYPQSLDELRRLLDGYLDGADVQPDSTGGCGLVSPHIDYMRGGPVYARVWKRAATMVKEAEAAVIFGTDHFGGTGLNLTRQNYATPFGVLPTAGEAVDALAEVLGEAAAFAGELRHRGEHSIELAAVWLHHMRGGEPCQLVPILCGSLAPVADRLDGVLEALRRTTAGKRTIFVAAGDLSHVGPAFGGKPLDLIRRARLKAADDELIERMCAGDAEGFYRAVQRDGDENNVCGLAPIYLTLRLTGAARGECVSYDLCPADEQGTSMVSVCGVVLREEK